MSAQQQTGTSTGASSNPTPSSTPASSAADAFKMPVSVSQGYTIQAMGGHPMNPLPPSSITPLNSMLQSPVSTGSMLQASQGISSMHSSTSLSYGNMSTPENEKIHQYIQDLLSPETRETALMELSRKREQVPDMALVLWNSFGAITALLHEIISVYPTIHPPTLNAHQSNRVCNALALLQCVASHPETRNVFLQANIPLFLYPFLNMNTSSKTRPFEYLRLTSLGVIGALVKTDEKEVINFLLKTEIIPLCLRIMESGTELSKTVATFILQKILLDETGLNYICQTYDRFSHVAMILAKMVIALSKEQSARLLKHVIRCYLRLSDNPRAREAMRHCLPDQLRTNTFHNCLMDDRTTKGWLMQLLKNVDQKAPPNGSGQQMDMNGTPLQPLVPASGAGTPGQTSPSPSSMMSMGGMSQKKM